MEFRSTAVDEHKDIRRFFDTGDEMLPIWGVRGTGQRLAQARTSLAKRWEPCHRFSLRLEHRVASSTPRQRQSGGDELDKG
ncbi:hypothetical protein E2C01_027727 [Portunus trituberculatus]|uniref:Uncharacterized protein n=1 Tax=Portunus trituberculatus TaxID=210409 RepID=A0A5B7EJF6_PORTR|nr:hypothetical protein [Portunus trituberculatus]